MSKRSRVLAALAELDARPRWRDCQRIAREAGCSPRYVSQVAAERCRCSARGGRLCRMHQDRLDLARERSAVATRIATTDHFRFEPCLAE